MEFSNEKGKKVTEREKVRHGEMERSETYPNKLTKPKDSRRIPTTGQPEKEEKEKAKKEGKLRKIGIGENLRERTVKHKSNSKKECARCNQFPLSFEKDD